MTNTFNKHVVNTWWVSGGFFLVNVSFNTAQNFATSVAPLLGSISLSLLYLGYILSLLFIATKMTMFVGCKHTLFICGIIYCGYIAASIEIINWVYLISAILLGLAGGPFWVSQGLFVQLCSNEYEIENNLMINSKLGYFNGIFTFGYIISKFIGSIIGAIIFEFGGNNTILYSFLVIINIIGALTFLLINGNLKKDDINIINEKRDLILSNSNSISKSDQSTNNPINNNSNNNNNNNWNNNNINSLSIDMSNHSNNNNNGNSDNTSKNTNENMNIANVSPSEIVPLNGNGNASETDLAKVDSDVSVTNDNTKVNDISPSDTSDIDKVVLVTHVNTTTEMRNVSGVSMDIPNNNNNNNSNTNNNNDDVSTIKGNQSYPSVNSLNKKNLLCDDALYIIIKDISFKYLIPIGLEWGVMSAWIASDFSALMISNTLKFYILAIEGFVGGVMSIVIGHYIDKIGTLLIFVLCNVAMLSSFIVLYFWDIDQESTAIWVILAILIGFGDAGYYTIVPHMFPSLLGARSEVFAIMKCLLAIGTCGTFLYYTFMDYHSRLIINIILSILSCVCIAIPKNMRQRLAPIH